MLRLGILEEVETINFVLFEPSKIETSKSVIPVENNLFGAGRFGSTTSFWYMFTFWFPRSGCSLRCLGNQLPVSTSWVGQPVADWGTQLPWATACLFGKCIQVPFAFSPLGLSDQYCHQLKNNTRICEFFFGILRETFVLMFVAQSCISTFPGAVLEQGLLSAILGYFIHIVRFWLAYILYSGFIRDCDW